MCTGVFVISLIIIGSVFGCDENQARIRYYYNTMNNYTELCMDEAEKIFSTSWYNPHLQTIIFCHGFTGTPKGPAITGVVSAYLSLGTYNVALLNWEKLAAIALPGIVNSYINWAFPNSIQVAGDLSEAMLRLSAAGLDMNRTHFVGHSLGAHIFGIAGNKCMNKGLQFSCIIALDPAIGFDTKPAFLRLRPTSARFVAVVHSDPTKYGTKKNMGVVDFWPNFKPSGPVLQPGCPVKAPGLSNEEFCSHNRSWKLLAEAITNSGTVIASHAKNYRMWNKYNEEQRKANVLDIGVCNENALPGNYYFTTAAESPYGLGEKGL